MMFYLLLVPVFCVKSISGSLSLQTRSFDFDHELASCASKAVDRLRTETNFSSINLYTSNFSLRETSMLIKHLSDVNLPFSLLIMNIDHFQNNFFINKRFCIIVIATEDELRKSLRRLHYDTSHDYYMIYVSFFINQHLSVDPIKYLSMAIDFVWTHAFPRNIVFVVRDSDGIYVLGAPAYSPETCSYANLIELAYCRDGKIVNSVSSFYPNVINMYGCELNVAIKLPVLPYVEKIGDDPKGTIGHLVTETASAINFTAKFKWINISYLSMTNDDDIDILIDVPSTSNALRREISLYLFYIPIVWIVPSGKKSSVWNKLSLPFDQVVWILIGVVFLVVFSLLFILGSGGRYDRCKIFLMFFGILLAIGTDIKTIPKDSNFRLLMYYWMCLYVLVQGYLASLAGTFTKPPPNAEIDTAEQLLKSDLDVMCLKAFKDIICGLDDDVSKRLCDRCEVLDDKYNWMSYHLQIVKYGTLNRTATIFNLDVLRSYPSSSNIHVMENWTNLFPVFLITNMGSVFTTKVGNLRNTLFENGVYQYWMRMYISTKTIGDCLHCYDDLRWKYFECGVMVLLIGYLISFVVFLGEIAVCHLRINWSFNHM